MKTMDRADQEPISAFQVACRAVGGRGGAWPSPGLRSPVLEAGKAPAGAPAADAVMAQVEWRRSVDTVLEGRSPDQVVDDLIERYGGSKRERIIMYHGTTYGVAKDILARGLQPFPDKRAWDRDDHTHYQTVSRVSYGGIYLTTNLGVALSSSTKDSGSITDKGRPPTAIVIVEVQPRSLVADEDDLTGIARPDTLAFPGYYFTQHVARETWVAWKTGRDMKDDREAFVTKAAQKLFLFADRTHPKLRRRVEELLRSEGWEAVLTRAAAHAFEEKTYDIEYQREQAEKKGARPPNVQTGEKVLRRFIDRLTRTMKNSARPRKFPGRFGHSARSLDPITTRSKGNRIICVVRVRELPFEWWMDKGDVPSAELTVMYGKIPSDFIHQYRAKVGDHNFEGNRLLSIPKSQKDQLDRWWGK